MGQNRVWNGFNNFIIKAFTCALFLFLYIISGDQKIICLLAHFERRAIMANFKDFSDSKYFDLYRNLTILTKYNRVTIIDIHANLFFLL